MTVEMELKIKIDKINDSEVSFDVFIYSFISLDNFSQTNEENFIFFEKKSFFHRVTFETFVTVKTNSVLSLNIRST